MGETLLLNYMEFAPVGHVVELLRYALGYHAADPSRRVGVLLPANSPRELVALCPFVDAMYPVSPMLGDLPGSLEGCRGTGTGSSTTLGVTIRPTSLPGTTSTASSRPPTGCCGRAADAARSGSSRTGFGMAALAVATPWLTISGAAWQEYCLNGVPFYEQAMRDRFACLPRITDPSHIWTFENAHRAYMWVGSVR